MRRKTAAVIIMVSLLILLFAAATIFSLYVEGSQNYSGVTRRATDYLVANYNPSIGMISETPGGSTYFVYSDNFLAAYVLGRATTRPPGYRRQHNVHRRAVLGYGARPHEPVPGHKLQQRELLCVQQLRPGPCGVVCHRSHAQQRDVTLSPSSHADIAFLEALYWHQIRGGYVFNDFALGVHLYDGRGFVDNSSSGGVYQTYKLALYDYVGKIVGAVLPRDLDADLARLQAPDGGFYTGYASDFSPIGSTNTETTSLAILALSTPAAKVAQPYSSSYYLPVFITAIAPSS
jgi:hypothetical protein